MSEDAPAFWLIGFLPAGTPTSILIASLVVGSGPAAGQTVFDAAQNCVHDRYAAFVHSELITWNNEIECDPPLAGFIERTITGNYSLRRSGRIVDFTWNYTSGPNQNAAKRDEYLSNDRKIFFSPLYCKATWPNGRAWVSVRYILRVENEVPQTTINAIVRDCSISAQEGQ